MRTVTFGRLGRLGRLGNQLFQIAGALAVARREGCVLSLPQWGYAKWFSVPEAVFGGAVGQEAELFAGHLGAAAPYLQDYSLVASVEETVRQWFTPSGMSLIRCEVPARDGHRTAVHVRRTDYLTLRDHYVIPTADWYMRAVDQAAPDATTVHVYTDDVDWCRDNLPGEWVIGSTPAPAGHTALRDGDGHPLAHPGEMNDFWALATADVVVAANSAFSWWAAFLSADPHPTVPARWYGPAYAHLSEDRIIPPHWTRVA